MFIILFVVVPLSVALLLLGAALFVTRNTKRGRTALYTGLLASLVGLLHTYQRSRTILDDGETIAGWPWAWWGYHGLGNWAAPFAWAGGVLILTGLAGGWLWLADQLKPRLPTGLAAFSTPAIVVLVLLTPLGALWVQDDIARLGWLGPEAQYAAWVAESAPVVQNAIQFSKCTLDLVPDANTPEQRKPRLTATVLVRETYQFTVQAIVHSLSLWEQRTETLPIGDHQLEFIFDGVDLNSLPPGPYNAGVMLKAVGLPSGSFTSADLTYALIHGWISGSFEAICHADGEDWGLPTPTSVP